MKHSNSRREWADLNYKRAANSTVDPETIRDEKYFLWSKDDLVRTMKNKYSEKKYYTHQSKYYKSNSITKALSPSYQ